MNPEREYKKGADAALDRDFQGAAPFGKVKVGDENLYWKIVLRWYYMPMKGIARAYRRLEEVKGRTGCCSNDFSIHKLMLVDEADGLKEVKIGESLYRHEPEALLEELKKRHPQIAIGKA